MVECVQLRGHVDEIQKTPVLSAMRRSLSLRETIRLKMNDPQEELLVEGVIDQLDPEAGKFGVDGEYFEIADVAGFDGEC
jgi:hypothetical protein